MNNRPHRAHTMPVLPSQNQRQKPFIDDSLDSVASMGLRPQKSAADVERDPLFDTPSHSPFNDILIPSVPSEVDSQVDPGSRDELLVHGFIRTLCRGSRQERSKVAIFGFVRPLIHHGLEVDMLVDIILTFCGDDIILTFPLSEALLEVVAKIWRLYAQRPSPEKFASKFTNHAKGNFYISKEMIKEMMARCHEHFDTDVPNDEKRYCTMCPLRYPFPSIIWIPEVNIVRCGCGCLYLSLSLCVCAC